jgi:hypothetical protein
MDFHTWLDEHVAWSGYLILRRKAIRRFARGLYTWLKGYGFAWACGEQELGNRIANGLYDSWSKAHLESCWPAPQEPEGAFPEAEDHYRAVVDWEAWENFWVTWGVWGDFRSDEFRSADRRLDLQEFVWGQLDLENSPQTDVLLELLGAGDDDEDGGIADGPEDYGRRKYLF